MSDRFFEQPILNSPYRHPSRHWQLDENGQPTQRLVEGRRPADFVTPIPKAKHKKGRPKQQEIGFGESLADEDPEQLYDVKGTINTIRRLVDDWRTIKDPSKWGVTPETARLLQHWRHHEFLGVRPFFCQVEAVETAIWLTEVAPNVGKAGKDLLEYLERANRSSHLDINRLSLKLATGAGKTTVMAMLIAWQTVNAVRHPSSSRFTRSFLVITPGITIKDRLQVLQPNDPYSYYKDRELVPPDMLPDLDKARIVITNYHAFKKREKTTIAKGTKALLQGRGEVVKTLETEGEMIKRAMGELMGSKGVMVINDEAHHCYRERPALEADEFSDLKGEDKKDAKAEAKERKEMARLWIAGIEAANRQIGVKRVFDLSATPFFLRGSGYAEGSLFPWTMSDFSLMDAIECGIVKLPRVPVSDNIPGSEMPVFRELWKHIGNKMPKKRRSDDKPLDPLNIPTELQTALSALYGHYKETYELWYKEGMKVPPCFIVVCNNTSTSKLVYDYISGFYQELEDGAKQLHNGRLELFQNFDTYHTPYPRPRTILVDSVQLESGEALDKDFREIASDEIERYRREIVERTGDQRAGDTITDTDLLREVLNTVGKPGRLGADVRCVVSVSMLTEGWDANTVTHILGVRAFGTQLLCEQVVGRALRRQSYEVNDEGLFDVEYADVLGIPFDFTTKPVVSKAKSPRETIQVQAIRPDRDHAEITFPRVVGYRVDLPEENLKAEFNEDSVLRLTPELVGPSVTQNEGIIGKGVTLGLKHLDEVRRSTLLMELTTFLIYQKFRTEDGQPRTDLFADLKRITREWLDDCLQCVGDTKPAQLMYKSLAEVATERISAAITRSHMTELPVRAVIDPYNPGGSTRFVNFTTSKTNRWETDSRKCHVNYAILDSDWEGEFCRVLESHPKVLAYVKNHNLGFEVPYQCGSESRRYLPDYIVLVDDGHGPDDPLRLVVEVKGYRREDAKEKKSTMETYWVPGVNNLGEYGRWAFTELRDVWEMQTDFDKKIEEEVERITKLGATVTLIV